MFDSIVGLECLKTWLPRGLKILSPLGNEGSQDLLSVIAENKTSIISHNINSLSWTDEIPDDAN